MICNVIDNDFLILKIFSNDKFDIYDHGEIKGFIKSLFDNILNKYGLSGNIIFNVFIDRLYGMIIEIKKESNAIMKEKVDIKIKFNLNVSFLYEVDYFYLIDNNIVNQYVYYYNDKFYLEIINDIKENDYTQLLENCLVIYDDEKNNIINNGIKLTNIKNI